jgi:hypothetical protein
MRMGSNVLVKELEMCEVSLAPQTISSQNY